MNGTWRELNPNDTWSVVTRQPLQAAEIGVLMHLYQPIIGTDTVSLYITLCMQGDLHTASEASAHTHRFLMNLLNLPLDRVLAARYRLEGIGLLRTFKRQEELGRSFRYDMIPPLEPAAFFQTDVLSITLMNRLGKERFRQVRERYLPVKQERETSAVEVTKKFNDVFTSFTPSELTIRDESEMQSVLAEFETAPPEETVTGPSFAEYALDWDFLQAQAASVGSISALTETDREKIREWAFFYQLDDMSLGKALQNPDVYSEDHQLNLDDLHAYIKQEYRFRHGQAPDIREVNMRTEERKEDSPEDNAESLEERHRRWLAKLSPLELLERYQQGGKVPEADVQLVEELYEKYGLPYGVINVLVEFVLFTHDYKLPRPLVEKMAGHWKRANVKTVEEAQELALKQLYQKDKPKPVRSKTRTKAPSTPKQADSKPPPKDTEESRRQRQVQFEKLLGKLQQARSRGE